jgi:hypothetical protein
MSILKAELFIQLFFILKPGASATRIKSKGE